MSRNYGACGASSSPGAPAQGARRIVHIYCSRLTSGARPPPRMAFPLSNHTAAEPPSPWRMLAGVNCYAGFGATEIDIMPVAVRDLAACRQLCSETTGCVAVTLASNDPTQCYRRSSVNVESCDTDDGSPQGRCRCSTDFDTHVLLSYVTLSSPPPSPPPPSVPFLCTTAVSATAVSPPPSPQRHRHRILHFLERHHRRSHRRHVRRHHRPQLRRRRPRHSCHRRGCHRRKCHRRSCHGRRCFRRRAAATRLIRNGPRRRQSRDDWRRSRCDPPSHRTRRSWRCACAASPPLGGLLLLASACRGCCQGIDRDATKHQ